VAMAAAAEPILAVSGLVDAPPGWAEVADLPVPEPSPEVEATARLGAALHGAHRLLATGDKAAALAPWCEAALAASPGIAAAFADLVEARAAPAPAVLTAAQPRNFASPYRLGLQHGWAWDHVDADALTALLAVIERRDAATGDELRRTLLRFRGIRAEGTELAAPPFFYLWEPLERPFPEVMELADLPRRAFLRSPWPETGFALLTDAAADLAVELTARLARPTGQPLGRRGPVLIEVNGAAVGAVEVGESWTAGTARLDRHRLWPGLNRLTLRWPELPAVGELALAEVLRRLELGRAADFHPIFGEVFSLVVRPVG
jgi:hypothetical protein